MVVGSCSGTCPFMIAKFYFTVYQKLIFVERSKVVPHSIMSVGLGSDPSDDLAINPVVGCRYFPPGARYLYERWASI